MVVGYLGLKELNKIVQVCTTWHDWGTDSALVQHVLNASTPCSKIRGPYMSHSADTKRLFRSVCQARSS